MMDASNTVQILVECAMKGIRLIQQNCLRWGRTTETGSQINVCAIYGIQFAPMNCLLLGSATKTVSRIKVCVIYDIRFTRTNYFQLGNTTETVQLNKMCVIHGKQPTRMNGARRGRLNGEQNARTDASRACLRRLNSEQPHGQPSAINKFWPCFSSHCRLQRNK